MISFRQVEELLKSHQETGTVVSLYLGANGNSYVKKDCEIIVKDLIKEKEKELEALVQDKDQRAFVEKDLEKIRHFIKYEFDWKGKKGLALFASASRDLWQIFPLPRPVRNILVVDRTPYTRPLIALLDEYRRLCIVVVDRTKARIFEVFLGEIEEHSEIFDDVPRKAKAGGWKGYEEARIQRHMNDGVHKHYKNVGENLMDFFKTYRFDSLVLAGHRSDFSEFERELHPYLKERVIARIEMDVHAPEEDVLARALQVEKTVRKDLEGKLLERLKEMTGERMAVTGILGTLTAHRRGQIHSLIVSESFKTPGTMCPQCGYLDQELRDCPACRRPMHPIVDLVDELIEAAVGQGCRIEYVSDANQMQLLGGIGAFLRFKI